LVLENSQSLFIQDARRGKKVVRAMAEQIAACRGSSAVPAENSTPMFGNMQIDDKVMTRSHASPS
jgi:hypothetical protein